MVRKGIDSDVVPLVRRSFITDSSFDNISPTTQITRSVLGHSTVRDTKAKSEIARCHLSHCTIAASSSIQRCRLSHSEIIDAKDIVSRVTSSNTKLIGAGEVTRSLLGDSFVTDSSRVDRSTVKASLLTSSRVVRSSIRDCEVVNCYITRTNMRGKVVKNGIWENGRLVGRTCGVYEAVGEEARSSPDSSKQQLPPEKEVLHDDDDDDDAADEDTDSSIFGLGGGGSDGLDDEDSEMEELPSYEAAVSEESIPHAQQSKQ